MADRTLAQAVFDGLEQNEYLKQIYQALLYNNFLRVFDLRDLPNLDVNLDDAIRFADLLSQSTGTNRAEQHIVLAQEMATLLLLLYPNDNSVRYAAGSVLSSARNYLGVKNTTPEFCSPNIIDQVCIETEKDHLRIPNTENDYFLTTQKAVYDRLFTDGSISYSGPTSMGKSFVMRTFIRECIINHYKYNFAVIVPTKALISEVSNEIVQNLQYLLPFNRYKVVTTSGGTAMQGNEYNYIFVMTPERMMYQLMNHGDIPVDYVFIDEAQNISENDGRSAYYYQIVNMLCARQSHPHIIFASPQIANPSVYLQLIPDADANESDMTFSFSPVSQEKFIIDILSGHIGFFNGYTQEMHTVSINGSIADDDGYDTFFQYLSQLGQGRKNLVYVNSTAKVVELAQKYSAYLSETHDSELDELSEEIKGQIHDDFFLASLVKKGIGYHVGQLPIWLRNRIEALFRKRNGGLHTIFCTSTLMEGVNLPADNLFVLDNKNGPNQMTAVEFRNLIGRVGRIQYGLYGNVFFVCLPKSDASSEAYIELLKKPVERQSLSLGSITPEEKQYIVDHLKAHDTRLPVIDGQSKESYALMRKTANILLRDIVSGRKSRVLDDFADYLNTDDIDNIRFLFTVVFEEPDDDINMSVDQLSHLKQAIMSGLRYPNVGYKGYVSYEDAFQFLEKLCKIFDWETYESSSLGRLDKNGEHGVLKLCAKLLTQWFTGKGITYVVNCAVDYRRTRTVYFKGQHLPFDGSQEHINLVIDDTLRNINDLLLFRLSSYFMRFSSELKAHFNEEYLDNDWSEYLEYGTTDWRRITLQKYGFSAEVAAYIEKHAFKYLSEHKTPLLLKPEILKCGKTSVRTEAELVHYNLPEVFM